MSKSLISLTRNLIAACALVAALAGPALAGHIPNGVVTPADSASRDGVIHTPPSSDQLGADGHMQTGSPESAAANTANNVGGEISTPQGVIHNPMLALLYLLGAMLP